MSFEAIAEGSAYYRVKVNGTEVSKHTTWHKAMQSAVGEARQDPEAEVFIYHDLKLGVTAEGGVYLYIEQEEVA